MASSLPQSQTAPPQLSSTISSFSPLSRGFSHNDLFVVPHGPQLTPFHEARI